MAVETGLKTPPSDARPQERAHSDREDAPQQHELSHHSPTRSGSTSPREVDHTTGSCNPPQLPITTERHKRAKRSRNPARERLQSELKHLRVVSTELEQRLAALQQQTKLGMGQEERLALAAWEYVAERQLHERTRVERVNAQLRAQVQSNLEMTKRLRQAVCELPRLHDPMSFERLFDLSDAFPRRLCVVPEEVAVYETLASQVDAAFSRMESVFQANGLSAWRAMDAKTLASQSQMKTQRSSQPVDDDGEALAIELIDVDVLPFAKESVFRAMWCCWKQHYMAKNAIVYEFAHGCSWTKDTIAGRMHFDVSVDGAPVALQVAFVLKWFIAEDCICYVWRAMSTADATHFSGVYIDETGWEELRAVPAQDASGVEGTLTLSCSQMVCKKLASNMSRSESDPSASALDVAAVAAPLTNVMISSYEADLVEVSCLMMDLLLEEIMTQYSKPL